MTMTRTLKMTLRVRQRAEAMMMTPTMMIHKEMSPVMMKIQCHTITQPHHMLQTD